MPSNFNERNGYLLLIMSITLPNEVIFLIVHNLEKFLKIAIGFISFHRKNMMLDIRRMLNLIEYDVFAYTISAGRQFCQIYGLVNVYRENTSLKHVSSMIDTA